MFVIFHNTNVRLLFKNMNKKNYKLQYLPPHNSVITQYFFNVLNKSNNNNCKFEAEKYKITVILFNKIYIYYQHLIVTSENK